jgi:hypothetical protein
MNNPEYDPELEEAIRRSREMAEGNFMENSVTLMSGLKDAPEARKRLILISALDFARTVRGVPNDRKDRIKELITHFKDSLYSMTPVTNDELYDEASGIIAEFGQKDNVTPGLIVMDSDFTELEEKEAAEEIAKIEAAVAKMKANEEAAAMRAEEEERKKKENTDAARRAAFEKRFGPGKSGGRRNTRRRQSRRRNTRRQSRRRNTSRRQSRRAN